jgi:GH35 family endo-1,4-beta-xylanase
MKIRQIVFLLPAILILFGCNRSSGGKNETGAEKNDNSQNTVINLTIGDKRDLTYLLPDGAANATWESSNPMVVSVIDGIAQARNFNIGGLARYAVSPATGSADITVKAEGNFSKTITINTTTEALVDIMTLPPLKDQFGGYFMMGSVFNPNDASDIISNARLTRHFNILTPENNMKPAYLCNNTNRETYNTANLNTAMRMVDAAIASGMKVQGHTLLWHNQIPSWQKNIATDSTSAEDALSYMKEYITYIVKYFEGKIYAWDILNEIFPDGVSASSDWKNSMRATGGNQGPNPWYVKIGSGFVYEGYKAARLADPSVILYYNDYNLDQSGKATMVRNMVRDVNQQWEKDSRYDGRKLIEGIGMQSHHNTGVSVNNIRNTLNLFRGLGVRISISELDILAQSWSDFSGSTGQGTNKNNNSSVTNSGLMNQARLYGDFMKLFIEYSDIIERVSFWGLIDNQSWRSGGLPLLFDPEGKAKPAYYYLTGALNQE